VFWRIGNLGVRSLYGTNPLDELGKTAQLRVRRDRKMARAAEWQARGKPDMKRRSDPIVELAKVTTAPDLVASYALLLREARPIVMHILWIFFCLHAGWLAK
jgi:hypothetical protein